MPNLPHSSPDTTTSRRSSRAPAARTRSPPPPYPPRSNHLHLEIRRFSFFSNRIRHPARFTTRPNDYRIIIIIIICFYDRNDGKKTKRKCRFYGRDGTEFHPIIHLAKKKTIIVYPNSTSCTQQPTFYFQFILRNNETRAYFLSWRFQKKKKTPEFTRQLNVNRTRFGRTMWCGRKLNSVNWQTLRTTTLLTRIENWNEFIKIIYFDIIKICIFFNTSAYQPGCIGKKKKRLFLKMFL